MNESNVELYSVLGFKIDGIDITTGRCGKFVLYIIRTIQTVEAYSSVRMNLKRVINVKSIWETDGVGDVYTQVFQPMYYE